MATAWKMPPSVKIYEALGACGDGRVTLNDNSVATVRSSDGAKSYRVEIADDGRTISSNDNASYWQGYLGYPALAVLIARGMIVASHAAREALAGINWKEINRRFRNDYAKTIAIARAHAESRGVGPAALDGEVEAVMAALRALAPIRGRRVRPPAQA